MDIIIPLKKEEDLTYHVSIGDLPMLTFDRKVIIVTNPTVGSLHLEFLKEHIKALELYTVMVPDGEDYKTMQSIDLILNASFEHRLDRKSLMISLGGGVICDMTGFASSLYQRGIDFVQIPTTLLSQVDASVGGKTGINNNYGKNLIGAFHQPKAVYIDPYFLKTLPVREFASGVAEIIKMAVTFDHDFFSFLSRADFSKSSDLLEAIERSVKLKAKVVAEDEKEQGIRAALNYGHTFGHVIEHEEGYGTYLHGEAVAIGMVMANKVAVKLGLLSDGDAVLIERLLNRHGLKTDYVVKDVEHFYDMFFLDKKSLNNKITFILPKGIGDVVLTDEVTKSVVTEVLLDYTQRVQNV